MGIVSLDMERAATELGLALVVELHPRGGLVKARAFPLEVVLGGGGRTHEGGEEVNGAAEGAEDGPRRPVGEEREQIHGTEGGLPRARIVPVPEKRGRAEEKKGGDQEYEGESEELESSHPLHGFSGEKGSQRRRMNRSSPPCTLR